VRAKVLLDEDHAGRARLRRDAERSLRRRHVGEWHDRGRHGEDERQVQGDGQQRLSRRRQGEGEQ